MCVCVCGCALQYTTVPTRTVVGVTVSWFYGGEQNKNCSGENLHAMPLTQTTYSQICGNTASTVSHCQYLQWAENKTYKLAFSVHKHKERCDIKMVLFWYLYFINCYYLLPVNRKLVSSYRVFAVDLDCIHFFTCIHDHHVCYLSVFWS